MPVDHITLSATEFKTKCLTLFKKLDDGTLCRVTITKRGRPVAVVERARMQPKPAAKRKRLKSAHGFMKGTIWIAPGVDLIEPVID
jgi:antitoxin (DNA-binding transcriptional repressor) of toxin-antitoxin stability system